MLNMVPSGYLRPGKCKISYSTFRLIFNCGTENSTSPNFEFIHHLTSTQILSLRFPSMSFLFALLCLVVSVAAQTHYLYGPQWGWYSVKGTNEYILSAETTLTPGPPPTHVAPRLALWPGLNTAMGLIQPIIVNAAEGTFRGA
jgi:hypothetical protein